MIALRTTAHLSRQDNLAKVIGYAILVLHWFNPLVWIAFKLFVTDMEMSCDESVIRKAKTDIRKEYSQSLLDLSIEKSTLDVPMAFGKSNPVKVKFALVPFNFHSITT